MKTTKAFSKALSSLQTLLLITTTLIFGNLTALGQSEDLSKRNKILELTIDDLKYDNRNCVIMNRVLGDELKQTSDSLNFCRFKLLKLDSTVNVQSAKIQALQSSKSTLIWAVSILGVILLGIAFIWVRLIGHVKSV
jgi:hypothetical protein